jgi:hypothetical protein
MSISDDVSESFTTLFPIFVIYFPSLGHYNYNQEESLPK